ncbi:MAG: tetratricopeptide (TPR) repeat protein [Paracoccaceae bacterium]|jgi:tetratricopeptide (TPR) repeat protein
MLCGMTGVLVLPLVLALVLAMPVTAGAQKPPASTTAPTGAKKYTNCMALARSDPEKAVGVAAAWERTGGEEGARHCSAVALLNNGAYEEAARRLESLAATSRRPGKRLKAELLAQAGQAWLIAGKTTEALSAQTRALDLAGPRIELLLDRAITRASIGEYWDAIDDLNQAVDQDSKRVDALVFRATAWRQLKNLDLAQDDIARAVDLAPGNVDALLERGNILSLRGDNAAAAADWNRVISLDAKSPAADAARENLAKQTGPAKK